MKSVVEESEARVDETDLVLVAGSDDVVVANGSSRVSQVLYPELTGTVDVVPEGEEGIGAHGDSRQLGEPFLALFLKMPIG